MNQIYFSNCYKYEFVIDLTLGYSLWRKLLSENNGAVASPMTACFVNLEGHNYAYLENSD